MTYILFCPASGAVRMEGVRLCKAVSARSVRRKRVKELIDHIPFLDVIIVATVAYFIFIGWKQGTPKALMIGGGIYSGFLLASIYYHLFATALQRLFNLRGAFTADLLSFLILDVMISALMVALLLGLFGHVQITGRMAIFDRIGGALVGTAASVLLVTVLIMLLHAPYDANKQNLDLPNQVPAIQLFNDGYNKSMLGPQVMKLAPYVMKGTEPMLPTEARAKGAVPLLESVVAVQPTVH